MRSKIFERDFTKYLYIRTLYIRCRATLAAPGERTIQTYFETWKGANVSQEDAVVSDIAPGIIVRHTSRRLGKLDPYESCERLISGSISFSEFVDQVGEGYRELLDFMMEHDLHPSRPADVLHSIEFNARAYERPGLQSQLRSLYTQQAERRGRRHRLSS